MLKNGLIAGFASLVAVAVYFLVARDDSAETSPAPEQQVIGATVARIAAESRRARPEPVVRAVPQSLQPLTNADQPSDARPSPPEGYSFVRFEGQMPVAPIGAPVIPERPRADGMAWLDSPTAVGDLVNQSAAAGRPWSFGWIRMAKGARLPDLAAELDGSGAVILGSAGGPGTREVAGRQGATRVDCGAAGGRRPRRHAAREQVAGSTLG